MLPRQTNRTGYYLLYLFMLGLFLGILFVNIRHDVWIKDDGLLNAEMMKQLKNSELNGSYLFGYIVRHRISVILIVSLLASTVIGLPIVCAYVCYLGASAGCMLSVAVIRYGIRGVFFIAASIFPQGLLLIPAYFLLFIWSLDCNRSLYTNIDGMQGRYFLGRQVLLRKGIKLIGILILVLLGCIVESYVNSQILHFVLKIF
ncbi:MAG: stage II sporulation protein M [Lachnospiraceae bacterium]|nr:stage II sporulation protein M [Lachnospiraceae bacterium]